MTSRVPIAALTIALALGGLACRRDVQPAAAAPPALDQPPASAAARVAEVVVAHPTREPVRTEVEVPGTFVPFDETTISAEGSGPIVEIRVDEGDRVAGGQVLLVQDRTKAALAVKQAEAMLDQARANYARAKADLERKRQLLEERTIPQNQFDAFKAQHDAAAAAVGAAESALALARRQLEELTVAAPYAGVIKARRVAVGTYARPGDALFVLMRVDPIKLQFELPEKYAARVRAGLDVQAAVTALPGRVFTGRVRTVAPALAVESRAVRVEATVPNARYELKPGFFATVRVPLASLPGSVTVPHTALVRREGVEHVFVVRGGRAELQRVLTGAETADRVEVVTGLAETDAVVVGGADTLQPGDRVKVRG